MTSAGHRSRKTLTPVEIGATAQHRKCQTHLNPHCMQNLTLHNSMSRSRSGESSQDCGCRLKKQSFLSADLMVCRIIYVYRLCDEDELTNNDDNRAEPIPDKHDLEVN